MNSAVSELSSLIADDVVPPFVCAYPPRSAYRSGDRPTDELSVWRRDGNVSGNSLNLYIHIPFCAYICGFCNLYTTRCHDFSIHERYIEAVSKQLEFHVETISSRDLKTIYVGGGTPTLLPISLLQKLLDTVGRVYPRWRLDCSEVAIEASPDTLSGLDGGIYARALARLGFNRINIGVQSLEQAELKEAGRARASADKIVEALQNAKAAGIANISTDLIIGFEKQTDESWRKSVGELIQLEPQTISTYFLTLRPDAWFMKTGKYDYARDQSLYRRYDFAREMLKRAGYDQESNVRFVKPGRGGYLQKSLQFAGVPVLGVGAGARSYTNTHDYVVGGGAERSLSEVEGFIAAATGAGVLPRAGYKLTPEERMRKHFALGGFFIDLNRLRADERACSQIYLPKLEAAEILGLIVPLSSDRWAFSAKGLRHRDAFAWTFFSDEVRRRDAEFYSIAATDRGVIAPPPLM